MRTGEEWGNIYDHFAVIYEYENGTKLFANCRQMAGCSVDVSDHIVGNKGNAELMRAVIEGEQKWRYRGEKPNMYEQEHRAMFKAIRSSEPINNGEYMAKSSMMAIMGRMAAYHRSNADVGPVPQLDRRPYALQVRVGRSHAAAGSHARVDPVCVSGPVSKRRRLIPARRATRRAGMDHDGSLALTGAELGFNAADGYFQHLHRRSCLRYSQLGRSQFTEAAFYIGDVAARGGAADQ